MKIVVGVDDSPCSKAALEYVKSTSWPAGTRIVVLSVARPVVGAYAEVYVPPPPYMGQMMDDQIKLHKEISAEAEKSLRSTGLSTEARVLEGDPRVALVDIAKAEGADLIVVGSHGRSGIAKLLLGSVASHVVTHAPCNVLVVKQGQRPHA